MCPRKGTYGLPGIKMRLPFPLTPEEYALIDRALAKIARELSKVLPDPSDGIGLKEALLFLAQRVLETDPATALEGRDEREDSIYTILYHHCPECLRSHIATEDGPVEVSPDVVERVEARAHKVEIKPEEEIPPAGAAGKPEPPIDRPNPRSLLRKLHIRDGRVCANPKCTETRNLQGHPSGTKASSAPCATPCSLCCHPSRPPLRGGEGIIEAIGSPLTGIEIRTRGEKIAADLRAETAEEAEIPVVVAVRSSGNTDGSAAARNGGSARDSGLSGNTDNGRGARKPVVEPEPDEVEAFNDAVSALEKLEFPKREALSRALKALERLRERGDGLSAEALVKEAFRVWG